MQDRQKRIRTRLWQAWRRSGLTLNEIGHLLGKESDAQLSRYQSGKRLPTLRTALMLEIVLGRKIRDLFPEEVEELSYRIKVRAQQRRGLQDKLNDFVVASFCSFEELLNQPFITKETRMKIHRHCASLINRLNVSEEAQPGKEAND
jgi:transcriptional regulator with XRE-family HTH domain